MFDYNLVVTPEEGDLEVTFDFTCKGVDLNSRFLSEHLIDMYKEKYPLHPPWDYPKMFEAFMQELWPDEDIKNFKCFIKREVQ